MKKNKLLFFLCTIFIFTSCVKKQTNIIQKTEPEITNCLIEKEYCSYQILKNNFISGDPNTISYIGPQQGIIINSTIIPYDELYHYEPNAFSPGFGRFIKNEENLSYEKVLHYFSENINNDYILLANKTGYGANDEKYFVDGSHNIYCVNNIRNSEYAVAISNSDSMCYITYEFLIISARGLISADIMLKCSAFDIQVSNSNYFDYDSGQLDWKSPAAKKEFCERLESSDYKRLPTKISLLRDSKDLFLKSFLLK